MNIKRRRNIHHEVVYSRVGKSVCVCVCVTVTRSLTRYICVAGLIAACSRDHIHPQAANQSRHTASQPELWLANKTGALLTGSRLPANNPANCPAIELDSLSACKHLVLTSQPVSQSNYLDGQPDSQTGRQMYRQPEKSRNICIAAIRVTQEPISVRLDIKAR